MAALLLLGCQGDESGPAQGGLLGGDCPTGQLLCADQCVNPAADTAHCGACGTPCGDEQLCIDGMCQIHCGEGALDCGGVCITTVSDASNCGGCEQACGAGDFCDNGVCSSECSGVICPVGAQAACVHLQNNPDHCGSCGQACADGQSCVDGSCQLVCPSGLNACDEECIDLTSSSAHCGACGASCSDGVACDAGRCADAGPCPDGICDCPSGQEQCGTVCVDTQASNYDCGGCGVTCPEVQQCVSGKCNCPSDEELCGDECLDTQSDSANCGGCGVRCPGGQTCDAGSCACPGELAACDELCVDIDTSVEHCGACGELCLDGQWCNGGECQGEPSGAEDGCSGPARGIALEEIAVYQAVEVPIMKNGKALAADARNADVVRGRQALVRVFVTTEDDWSARQLAARLHWANGDDATVTSRKLEIDGDSKRNDSSTTYQFTIDADRVTAESRYWVELVECETPPAGVAEGQRFPSADAQALDPRETGPVKLVFVPIRHAGRLPDTSDATLKLYASHLEALYGTTEVITSLTAPIDSGSSSFDIGGVLDEVRAKRQADDPEADIYYHGLVKPADSFNDYCRGGCTTGVAYVTDTDRWSAAYRAGVSVSFGDRTSAETIAHELGHNHGLDHAPCGTDGDPNFPYDDGGIGVWGYDRRSSVFKAPSETVDLMSYCEPAWISDYHYQAIVERVSILNGATSELKAYQTLGMAQRWHVLYLTPDGAKWGIPYLRPEGPTGSRTTAFVYDSTGEVIAETDAYLIETSLPGRTAVLVPPPKTGWYAIGLPNKAALPY